MKNFKTMGLKRTEEMIEHRLNMIHNYCEEITLLKKRKSEILANKERASRIHIEWDIDRVKTLLDSKLSRKQIAAILNVSYHTLNSYIWRMREKGNDI